MDSCSGRNVENDKSKRMVGRGLEDSRSRRRKQARKQLQAGQAMGIDTMNMIMMAFSTQPKRLS